MSPPWADNVGPVPADYASVNPSQSARTLVFVHGWPGLWSTWSNQLVAFAPTYQVIALDMRGFGNSTHPGDARSSGQMRDHASDVRCVVQHALGQEGKAVCVGHDWGSQVCYESARIYPDTFEAAAGTIPYIPPVGPFVPIAALAKQVPTLTYQIYFDKKTDAAVAELDGNVRRALRSTYKPATFKRPEGVLQSDSDFLSQEDYIVKAYEASGFEKTLQFYTTENRQGHHEWVNSNDRLQVVVKQPTALIYPEADPVGDWGQLLHVLHSADFMPNLTVSKVPGAHWPHTESPETYNSALSAWLDKLPKPEGQKWEDKTFTEKISQMVVDEIVEEEPLPAPEEEPMIHEEL
ncbi:alpha/beta-hydrolase [Auriculariales sp. MPI-PUGE-AT-0066]|nr:alpha/beta-hydrolase [Auriculariales sp. MPI-PUGE-AT-0066]